MTLQRWFAILVLAMFARGVERARADEPAIAPAAKVQFVPELEAVEEIKLLGDKPSWTKDDAAQFAAQIAGAREAWKTEAAKIQKELTPEKVHQLSRWAKPQMAKYITVPALDKVEILPSGLTIDKRGIVFAGTIDTLPSHSSLVTRWLKVYFIFDLSTNSIRHTTITIRGEVLE